MPRSVMSGLVEPGVMARIPASLYTSEAGIVEEEQKWPTTALTLSGRPGGWRRPRLVSARRHHPLNQLNLLAVNAACGVNVFSGLRCTVPVLIAIGGVWTVNGPATPMTISACAENAVTRQPASTRERGVLINFSDIIMFLSKEVFAPRRKPGRRRRSQSKTRARTKCTKRTRSRQRLRNTARFPCAGSREEH